MHFLSFAGARQTSCVPVVRGYWRVKRETCGDDRCEKTDTVLENLDDQTEYSLLEYENGVRRVRIA
jgi:hypothetical protein